MPDKKQAEVEQLKERTDIKEALKQTAGTKQSATAVETKHKLWFATIASIQVLYSPSTILISYQILKFE